MQPGPDLILLEAQGGAADTGAAAAAATGAAAPAVLVAPLCPGLAAERDPTHPAGADPLGVVALEPLIGTSTESCCSIQCQTRMMCSLYIPIPCLQPLCV